MSYPLDRLRGRYRSMALIETLNAVILLPGLFWFFGWPLTVANLSGAIACAVLLRPLGCPDWSPPYWPCWSRSTTSTSS
ncbi:hypothetical protein [Enemella evansiae]|uniref:hypothetical protein n=1 Tax=Enemella evansiae TaxID=2016499 RepID=UPI00117F79CF|nr:hypothetical protein [Enemella evansiae]